MRELPVVLVLVLVVAACGHNEPVPGGTGSPSGGTEALCSPSYAPRELVDRGPLYSLRSAPPGEPEGTRTTDAAAIKKIAAAACSLPTPPKDVACTLEMGPRYELRFVDAQGRATTLTAESYGCQFVEGPGFHRFEAKPLWEALTAAGLPAANPR
jgi:hypothetical protein